MREESKDLFAPILHPDTESPNHAPAKAHETHAPMETHKHARTRQRILASVNKDPDSGCWVWRRQISNTGYGRITLSDGDGTYMESSHRASFTAFVGPIPEAGVIRQACGNRLCVNPDHLELVADRV